VTKVGLGWAGKPYRPSRTSSLAATTAGASAATGFPDSGGLGYLCAVWGCVCVAARGWDEGRVLPMTSRGPDRTGVSDGGGLTGGVWPRRVGPSGVVAGLDPNPGMFLLALFSGILRGATSRVSCTGSTMAERPLAPRQPGRDDVKAPAAGSVLPSRAAAAFFAILRTRSPKDGGAAAGPPFCEEVAIPRFWGCHCSTPEAFPCDGRPRVLLVCSPVSGSHRGASRGGGFRDSCCAGPRWVRFGSRVAASDCLRRSRRIEGMLFGPRYCGGLCVP